jgi:parallel beta-helix repeat protein
MVIVIALLVVGTIGFAGYRVYSGRQIDANASTRNTNCFDWSNQIPLQTAVSTNTCINIIKNTYNIPSDVVIDNRTVTINGNGATLVASGEYWVANPSMANKAILRPRTNGRLIANNLTLDGSNLASYLVVSVEASGSYKLDNMTLKNGACSAIGIFSNNVSVTNSTMTHNGHNCEPFSKVPEAAAIYAQNQPGRYHYSPVITGNTITDSYGPALDVNGAWGGTFSNNKVYGNTEWAAVSLYGASYWTISGNSISHPANASVQNYHPLCQPKDGPIKNRSAAIFLCQDSKEVPLLTNFNVIENNSASSGYGILLVGGDELEPWITPRVNTIRNNNVTGSLYGCADDLKLKQWLDGNTWENNNCLGKANTAPARF